MATGLFCVGFMTMAVRKYEPLMVSSGRKAYALYQPVVASGVKPESDRHAWLDDSSAGRS